MRPRMAVDGADDLVERFAANAQRHQEGAALGRRHLAGEQVVEGIPRLVARQRRACGNLGEIGFEGFHRVSVPCWGGCRSRVLGVPIRREIEEVAHDRHPMLGQDALGMELHAVDRQASGGTGP